MHVVILAAGQGKRLLPHTANLPKALLDIGGKPLIARQIEAFATHGVKQFTVVTGYGADKMEQQLAKIAAALNVHIATLYNPFYAVADNLASCWMARAAMTGAFVQVNGDNVFQADLVQKLLAAPIENVGVAINLKSTYDSDDMKVTLQDGKVQAVGKHLPLAEVNAEAIGFYVFSAAGAKTYVNVLEKAMRDPQALKQWFPSAITTLAQEIDVGTVPVDGIRWGEVDFPQDLEAVRALVADWE